MTALGAPTSDTDRLGRRFEWVRRLGAGGFGEVHLARMHGSGGLVQQVAVKLLHRGLEPGSQAVERLRDEAMLLASLRHPVVLAAHDLVELDGRVALVTEFVEGQDLAELIAPGDPGRMPPGTQLEVIEQVAGALDRAFGQLSVVHRDIKPANIRIGVHGNVKLLDFGIARSDTIGRSARTESAMMVGTMRYMAPERFDLEQEPTPASDVFSLGCVLYEGVAGEALTHALGLQEVFRLSMGRADWTGFVARRLEGLPGAGLPPGVPELLHDLLTHDPGARPTAAEVVRRCEALVAGRSDHVRLARWCRDRAWPDRSPPPSETRREATPGRLPSETSWVSGARPSHDTLLGAREEPPVPVTAPPPLPASRITASPVRPLRWVKWAALLLAAAGSTAAALATLVLVAVLARPVVPLPEEPPPERVAEEEAPPPPEVVPPAPTPEPVVVTAEPRTRPVPPAPPPRLPAVPPIAPEPTVTPEEPAPSSPSYAILLASMPAGAEITLVETGRALGSTPVRTELTAGPHAVRFVLPDGTAIERTLFVGRDYPDRYLWRVAEGRVEAGY